MELSVKCRKLPVELKVISPELFTPKDALLVPENLKSNHVFAPVLLNVANRAEPGFEPDVAGHVKLNPSPTGSASKDRNSVQEPLLPRH